jgi:hypothetical protein
VNRRGFSLIEVLLTSGILMFLVLAIFFAFDYGSRAFYHSTTNQNAQGEMTRAYSKLRKDLRQTHFLSVSTRIRTFDETRRDAICLGSVKNWSDEESFDEINGLPKWDRYIVYYGTNSGQLVRALLDLEYPDFAPAPFLDLSEPDHLNENPDYNDNELQSSYQIVSRRLNTFEADLEPSRDMILIRIKLKSDQGRKTETSEIRIDVSPQNTWPQA